MLASADAGVRFSKTASLTLPSKRYITEWSSNIHQKYSAKEEKEAKFKETKMEK